MKISSVVAMLNFPSVEFGSADCKDTSAISIPGGLSMEFVKSDGGTNKYRMWERADKFRSSQDTCMLRGNKIRLNLRIWCGYGGSMNKLFRRGRGCRTNGWCIWTWSCCRWYCHTSWWASGIYGSSLTLRYRIAKWNACMEDCNCIRYY